MRSAVGDVHQSSHEQKELTAAVFIHCESPDPQVVISQVSQLNRCPVWVLDLVLCRDVQQYEKDPGLLQSFQSSWRLHERDLGQVDDEELFFKKMCHNW